MVEIPWVLSRLLPIGRVLEVGHAFAEPAYLAGLLRSGVEPSGRTSRARCRGVETVEADVRSLPFPDRSFDQPSSSRRSSTSAPTTPCTASPPSATAGRCGSRRCGSSGVFSAGEEACSSRCRSASPATTAGSVRRTSRAGRRCSPKQGFFVDELELYELSRTAGARRARSIRAGFATGSAGRPRRRCSAPTSRRGDCAACWLRAESARLHGVAQPAPTGACVRTT